MELGWWNLNVLSHLSLELFGVFQVGDCHGSLAFQGEVSL